MPDMLRRISQKSAPSAPQPVDKTPQFDDNLSSPHASAADAVRHALALLAGWLARPAAEGSPTPGMFDGSIYTDMRRELPYLVHQTDIAGVGILVNREYKPVGCDAGYGRPWARYEAFTNLHVQIRANSDMTDANSSHPRKRVSRPRRGFPPSRE